MPNIRVGPYRLRSDPNQWIVSSVKTYQSGKLEGEEYDARESYHGSFQAAVNELLSRSMMDSEATTLQELLNEMNRFRGEVLRLFGVKL